MFNFGVKGHLFILVQLFSVEGCSKKLLEKRTQELAIEKMFSETRSAFINEFVEVSSSSLLLRIK